MNVSDRLRVHAGSVLTTTDRVLVEAADEIDRLRAELAECKRDAERDILKQDAERYRWIIKHMRLGIGQNGAYWSLTDATQVAPNHIGEVDATIDAALRGEE